MTDIVQAKDMERIATSVKKTGKCLIVYEDNRFGGYGADVLHYGWPVEPAWRIGRTFLGYEIVRTQLKLRAAPGVGAVRKKTPFSSSPSASMSPLASRCPNTSPGRGAASIGLSTPHSDAPRAPGSSSVGRTG